MTKAKPILFGVLFALLAQYPIALAFTAYIVFFGASSFIDGFEFYGFYFFMVTVIELPIILVIGIPLFHAMRRRAIDTNRNMLIAGGSIAAILATALTWPGYSGEGFSSGQNYYGTYREMIANGIPTFWGWIRFLEGLAMFATHGALGAAFFKLGWQKGGGGVSYT